MGNETTFVFIGHSGQKLVGDVKKAIIGYL